MIRYDTGDVAAIQHRENELPRITKLFGRRMDLIYDTNNEVVFPLLLTRTMRFARGVEQWQFIQDDETKYVLKINTGSKKTLPLEKEIDSFKKVLGENANIYVDDIPVMNSQKRKLIVSNLNQ